MAPSNVRTHDRRTDIAAESPFGTAGSWGTIYPIDIIVPEVMETNLDNPEESTFLFDKLNFVRGLQSAKCTVKGHVRGLSAALDQGSTTIATPADMGVFPLVMGGENSTAGNFPDGSTVQTSSTVSSIILDTDDGAKFVPHQPFIIEKTSGVLDFGIVGSIATDTITPELQPSAVFVTGKVRNTACWYFTPSNSNTISLRTSMVSDENAQWLLRGGQCPDSFKITMDWNKIIEWEMPLEFVAYSRGALSNPITHVADTSGQRFVAGVNAKCILQDATTVTKPVPSLSIESVTVECKTGMQKLPEIAGDGIGGYSGWMRVDGRDLITVTVKGRFNTALRTLYDNQTPIRFVYAVPYGSGLNQQWFFVIINKGTIADITKDSDNGGHLSSELVIVPQIDTSSTDTFRSTPLILATG